MRTTQLNKLMMYAAVHTALKNGQSTLNGNAVAAGLVERFNNLYASVLEALEIQRKRTQPTTANKRYLREQMIEESAMMAGFLEIIAQNNNDVVLAEKVNFRESELSRMSGINLLVLCKGLMDPVYEHIADLADFGIGEEQIEEFTLSVEAFESFLTAPRNAISRRAAVTKEVPSLIREIDKLLKKGLDKVMNKIASSDPKLHGSYVFSRKVIRTSGKSNVGNNGTFDDNSPPGEVDYS